MSDRAKELIKFEARERANNQNFLNLYQETSDYVYPLEDTITNVKQPGDRPKTIDLVDVTAILAAQDMASNMSATLFPAGQRSFRYESGDDDDEEGKAYLSNLTDAVHEQIFGPDFLPAFNEALLSWVVFGEGDVYVERGEGKSLNFMDYPAGSFSYLENAQRKPDQFIEMFKWTARQAEEKWGDDIGPRMKKALEKPDTENDLFEIVHVIKPRKALDPSMGDNMNLPYEDVYVGVMDEHIIFEGGFHEFPHSIGRYSKSSKEKHGRGLGVFVLPQARTVNAIKRDLVECANRHNRPPLEVSGNVDGRVSLDPGGMTYVTEPNSIRPINGAMGSYPITREMLELEREEIRNAFFADVFSQLRGLTGDRRTTLEISERLNEGLRRLSSPIARLLSEMLTPLLNRVPMIMIRAGMVEEPPETLQGRDIKIEYINPLVLALKRQQADAFIQWAQVLAELEPVLPGVTDHINENRAVRDLGSAFGVDANHIATPEEVEEKRAARAERQEQARQQEAMVQAAQSYGQTTTAPEDGSAAAQVQEAAQA